jgi:hypothetical protein
VRTRADEFATVPAVGLDDVKIGIAVLVLKIVVPGLVGIARRRAVGAPRPAGRPPE